MDRAPTIAALAALRTGRRVERAMEALAKARQAEEEEPAD
jgi:hypothetical protein